MNFDISTLCCNFLFIINSLIKYFFKKCRKKNQTNKNKNKKNRMFLKICLLAIFLNSNSNRKFIKNMKKSIMFLRTSFVELLISCY